MPGRTRSLPGLDAFAPEDRPPVWITFWAFRVMVAMGLAMVALGIWGAVRWALKRLDGADAVSARARAGGAERASSPCSPGWITAEVGRQPYVVYGVLRTADAVSPCRRVRWRPRCSLFIVVYAIVFSAGALYILRLIAKGPDTDERRAAARTNRPARRSAPAMKEARDVFGTRALADLGRADRCRGVSLCRARWLRSWRRHSLPVRQGRRERDQMQAAIAPVWDGNETWLVLGGGGLFAAFPKAYAALMPALYLPIILMLLALIFRGVAFEFRHHGRKRGKTLVDGSVRRRLDRRGCGARLRARRLHSGRHARRWRVCRRAVRLADAVFAAGRGFAGRWLCAARRVLACVQDARRAVRARARLGEATWRC